MAPKYRGDEEDWLDNEDLAGARAPESRAKQGPSARSTSIPNKDANATVAEVFPNQCRVKFDQDGPVPGKDLLCTYRRAEVVSKSKAEVRERTPVAVGDRVLAVRARSEALSKGVEQGGVIEGICARKNCISRPAPGRDGTRVHHVLAANIDLLVIVVSADRPKFSPGLIDRFLVGAESEGVPVVICVTKTDLLNQSQKEWEIYQELGYPVFEVSSVQRAGILEIGNFVRGKTVVFCGQSGVGKTSLLRQLLGTDIGKVGSVNESTGKGKHTTTGAILLGGPQGSKWIDTPGVREFGLANVTPEKLAGFFSELATLGCKQSHCLHLDEAGCVARDLPRYGSYRRILESLIAGEN
jgi:ribosome biogenesis GTPase